MNFEKPTEEQFRQCFSETAKYRFLTVKYCYRPGGEPGCGVDIASQGDPVVPWFFSMDLPLEEFKHYCGNASAKGPIQIRGHAEKLPFDSDSMDAVYSSHLLEDYLNWTPVLTEWVRVLKPGGNLIIIVPDRVLWGQALERGQPPNMSHRHESKVGELSTYAEAIGVKVIEDRLTAVTPGDYSILFVATKL